MTRPSFPWPDDSIAWWSFASSLIGGAWLVVGPEWHWGVAALTVAALAFFLASEWISHLSGRSRHGRVPRAEWGHPIGLTLLGVTAVASLAFYLRLDPLDRPLWQSLAATLACVLALIFILRLEWVPLDGRLVFLTHALLTAPVLLLGFMRWGVGDTRAYGLWLPLLFFFPVEALFAILWMQGPNAPPRSRSWLAIPALGGILCLAGPGSWALALFLTLFLARSIFLLLRRQGEPAGVSGLQAIRRLGWELNAWNALFCALWAFRR